MWSNFMSLLVQIRNEPVVRPCVRDKKGPRDWASIRISPIKAEEALIQANILAINVIIKRDHNYLRRFLADQSTGDVFRITEALW